ncbi:MAG: peptidoglycan-binding protein [Clostridia bacterium]|nr:peptidoglycan-binding protein [Clostridia bacterium]
MTHFPVCDTRPAFCLHEPGKSVIIHTEKQFKGDSIMKKRLIALILSVFLILAEASASAVSMKKGSKGLDPLFLNLRLAQLGYDVEATSSSYTAETSAAVKDFQGKNGIKVTGAVKDDTWAALFNEKFTIGIDALPEETWNSRGYYVSGSLVPPFSKVEVPDNSRGYKNHAVLDVDSYQLNVYLSIFDSMNDYITSAKANDKSAYDDAFVTNYGAGGYKSAAKRTLKSTGNRPIYGAKHSNIRWTEQKWTITASAELLNWTGFTVTRFTEAQSCLILCPLPRRPSFPRQ